MPQDIPVTYYSCRKNFSVYHSLSCPQVGIVLAQHDKSENGWGALISQAITPSVIYF